MARTTRSTRSVRKDEGTAQRPVTDQPTPFLGLLLAPFAALLLCWVIHYSIVGWQWGDWNVTGDTGYLGLATVVATLGAVAVGASAWHFSYDRKPVWRYALTGSATLLGLWLPVLIYNAPNRYLSVFFVLFAYIFSAVWAMPRLHVLRRDPRENDSGDGDSGSDLMRELGLEGYKSRGEPDIQYDESGDPTRIVVDVKHRFGGTRSKLQGALPNIESAVGGPEGMSRATAPNDGKSNHTIMTIMLKDPLAKRVPNPGPSSPGGDPTDPSTVGMYDDGEWVQVYTFGGTNPETGDPMPPSGYAFMGMTRSGKTVTENRFLLETGITRRGITILYLNKAKGGQDVQPIIAGVEAAVITDDRGDYRFALDKVRDILTYRQKQLARYGISAWSYAKCFLNPPTHTLDGKHDPMEPMPGLIVHVGEADAILAEAGEEAVYLASKGLSVGIVAGWSLQRWAATSMPTDLRFNIGTAFCFGVGDDYSASFALSEPTIKAGAHPENWKNRKPGRFFVENIGIPENRFPIAAKGIGDTDDDALYTNMRLLAEEYGPQMAKLDTGSARSTRGWWERQVRITDELRATMTPGSAAAEPEPPTPTDPPAAPAPGTPTPNPEAYVAPTHASLYDPNNPPPFVASVPGPGEDPDMMREQEAVEREIREMTRIDDQEIRGELITPDEDDPTGEGLFDEMSSVNPRADIPPPPVDDGIRFDDYDDKPAASTPQEAQLRFDQALREILDNPKFRDPDDPGSAVVRVAQLHEAYPFRARSWFSTMLSAMAEGQRECPPGIRLVKLRDRDGQGWYRITRSNDAA